MERLKIIGLLAVALIFAGCGNESVRHVDPVPAAPTGLNSITGDESVYLYWYAVGENDIEHYAIYRSETNPNQGLDRIETISASLTDYVDNDVINGATYYYRVSAIDESGQESDLSDYAMDTPRPEGSGVIIYDYRDAANYNRTGFDLYAHQRLPYDSSYCDIYLDYDISEQAFFIWVRFDDYYIQDFGYASSFDDVGYSQESGWSALHKAEAIEGHVYFLKLRHFSEWHYAKIWVEHLDPNTRTMTFSWAYQTDPGNRELKISPTTLKHVTANLVAN